MLVNETLLPSVITASLTILTLLCGGIGWLYKREQERREAAERQISERKRDAYLALLDIIFDMMKATRNGKSTNPSDHQMLDRMVDANKELVLYGSDEVIKIYQKWLLDLRKGNADLKPFGDLVVAIRRDMGNLSTKLAANDVLRQFIIDYDEFQLQRKV